MQTLLSSQKLHAFSRLVMGTALGMLLSHTALAAPPVTATPMEAVPPNVGVTANIKAMMMIAASKDHTLFGPMYTDFEDLDGDGTIDVTFKPDFKYYGYFDSTKCYLYSSSNSRFEPDTNATVSGDRYVCGGSNQWAGNFLNWATMTRLDVVRKMFYGGERHTDTATATVLQVTRLSRDSHSFVKYYRGTDIRDYTPFTTANLTKTTGSNPNVYSGLSMCIQADANDNGATSTPRVRLAKGYYRMWASVENNTVCDFSQEKSSIFGGKLSRYHGNAQPYFGNGGLVHEQNPPSNTTDAATYGGLTHTLNLRVQACVAGKIGEERCQAYGGGASLVYKPVGLLQEYGTPQGGSTSSRAEFGLITGSYDQNLKAGALRKNIRDLSDEIMPTTGQFCFSSGVTCPTAALPDGRTYTTAGLIKALNSIVLFGKTGTGYTGTDDKIPSDLTNGTLPAWGNPLGEMTVQALQYYAGLGATNPPTTTNDISVGMPVVPVAKWEDPMSDTNAVRLTGYGKSVCRPLSILAVSSSALSFDGEDADAPFATLANRSRGSLSDFTNAVGSAEGLHGTLRSVGNVAGTWGQECSAKTVTTLSGVNGVCPEAPSMGGTYKIAGAALYANTNRVRALPSPPPPDLPDNAYKVKTYAASLAGGKARIEVPVPGTTPRKFIYITPEGLWDRFNKKMTAEVLNLNSISSSATHGAFTISWNNALGGDYDMDIAGYLRYDITGNEIKVTTDILNVGAGTTGSHGYSIIGTNRDGLYLTHRNLTADTNIRTTPGYLCGVAAYSGAANLSTVAIPVNGVFPGIPAGKITGRGDHACASGSGGTTGLHDRDANVTVSFDMVGADSVTLRDPLWYAAKYGSFNPVNQTDSTELPNLSGEWDVERNDGEACSGASCQDGEPDGYFLARRPELLQKRLEALLRKITSGSNASPAVSSAQLSAGGYLYTASFSRDNLWGTVEAYQLSSTGTFNQKAWDASKKLADMPVADRQVITNKGVAGVPFTSAQLSGSASYTALKGSGTALTDAQTNDLIAYVRGDSSKEMPAGPWRVRAIDATKPVSQSNPAYLMGTIVNSSPWLQAVPAARQLPTFGAEPAYKNFVAAQKTRNPVLWVGSNDGMLHAFNAASGNAGTPLVSYVPSPLLGRLRDISQASTGSTITAGMDGSPYTADVLLNAGGASASWQTYLFSSLGRGGKAVFALNATNTGSLNEANAGNIFKWMFSSDDDSDMGHVLGDPKLHPDTFQPSTVTRMQNGKYALLVPNGVGSTAGKAFLYVLFVDGPTSAGLWTAGTHYIKLATDNLTNNGMVGVNWADTDGDGRADTLYGTDLLGRLWKFDARNANAANWTAALSGTPMFEAYDGSNRIPVTTAPVVSYPSFGGVMVGFGTGKALVPGDFPDNSRTQRFYSVYDKANWGLTAAIPSNLSTMLRRTAIRLSNGSIYISVASEINGTTVTASQFNKDTNGGWYINFPATATGSTLNNEMLLSSPQVGAGLLYFTTVRPSPSDVNRCYRDPQTTLYAVDPLVGTPKTSSLGTTNVTVGGETKKVNLAGVDAGGTQKMTSFTKISVKGKSRLTFAGQGTAGVNEKDVRAQTRARSQWREVPNMRTLTE